jgi:methionyl-tRNA formyltransferase
MAELAEMGARELTCALDDIEAGTVRWHEQDETQVSFARKIDKAELLLDPDDGADVNLRRVRASSDAAPARCVVAGKGVRVMAARRADGAQMPAPGMVRAEKARVLLGCADGALDLISVRPDGKRAMEARAWAQGLHGSNISWQRA